MRYKALKASEELVKEANKDLEANEKTQLLNGQAAKEELESQTVSLPQFFIFQLNMYCKFNQ